MRRLIATAVAMLLTSVWIAGPLTAQDKEPPPRFGLLAKLDLYPQDTPEKTLKSIVAALEKGEYAYVLAHMADPAFVDSTIKQNKLKFNEFVEQVKQTAKENPEQLRELRKFVTSGEWTATDTMATALEKSLPGRAVIMLKVGDRWFMSNDRTVIKGKTKP